MPRKPASSPHDTLKLIRAEGFRLFGRFGYEGVSVGDIAKAAKISKGALYWHFRGKDDLFLDCLGQLHALFNHHIFDPMRRTEDPVASIAHLFVGLGKLVQNPRVKHGVAGYWLVPSRLENEAVAALQRGFEDASMAVIRDVLHRGEAAGRFRLGDDLEDMSRAIISVVEAAALPLRHQTPDEVHTNLGVLARTLFRAYAQPEDLAAFQRVFG